MYARRTFALAPVLSLVVFLAAACSDSAATEAATPAPAPPEAGSQPEPARDAGQEGDAAIVPQPSAFGPPGTIDSAFGANGLAVIKAPANLPAPTVTKVLVQPDQKILLAGATRESWTFARMLPDGQMDPAYGIGGVARVVVAADEYLSDAVLDGTTLYGVGGVSLGASADRSIVIFRLDATGKLDPGFGSGGFVDTGRKTVADVAALRIAIAPGNKLVVAGESNVLRYSAAGAPDTTFGQAGRATVPMALGARPFAVEASGHVVVGGSDGVYRVQPNGQSEHWGAAAPPPRVAVARGQELWFLDKVGPRFTSQTVDPATGGLEPTYADSLEAPTGDWLSEGLLDASQRWVAIFETTASGHGLSVTRTKADFSGYDLSFGKSGHAVLGLQLVPVGAALAPDGRIVIASREGVVMRLFP